MKITKRIGAVLIASLLFTACASGPLTTREKGAGIGAVGGAAVGGILSQSWWALFWEQFWAESAEEFWATKCRIGNGSKKKTNACAT